MKSKFLYIILGFGIVFSLISCNKSNITIDSDNDSYIQNDKSANYSKLDIEYNTISASSSTSIEDTIDSIYDSVVAINVKGESFTASGSGVLFGYDEDESLSYIATCFHVIEDATYIEIVLSDSREFEASYVGGYSDGDIAILSIEALNLTYASFYDDTDKLRLGSTVICIGNPLGTLPGSVSTGVISYNNRVVAVDSYRSMTLIQTDVAINSGNSGGGLFNSAGALIGIVNAKYSTTGVEGLGFAIPLNQVKNIIDSISSTALFNSESKDWNPGYVVGDYEFCFTISEGYYSTGGFPSMSTKQVAYISNISTNKTTTGYNSFELKDIITSVTIDYADDNKNDSNLTSVTASSINTLLYTADLSIGDTIIFVLTRNNSSMTVSFSVTQYIYTM